MAVSRERWWDSRLQWVLLGVLLVIYLAQTVTPLRLNTDAIVLLSMAASFADGGGTLYLGQETHFATGYPVLVGMLDRAGVASSFSLVLINCVSLGMGLYCLYQLFVERHDRTPAFAIRVVIASLLSFVVIKHVTLPLSDLLFFGVFSFALLAMSRIRARDRTDLSWLWVAIAIAASLLAIAIRTAGVALLPGVVWALARPAILRWRASGVLSRQLSSIVLCATILAVVSGYLLFRTKYVQGMLLLYKDGLADRLLSTLLLHVKELGELFINAPISRAGETLHPVYLLAGFALSIMFAIGLPRRLREFSVTETVVLSYAAMIFIWPYTDARFWLPVIPLIWLYVGMGVERVGGGAVGRFAGFVWSVWFGCLGAVALAYSTQISYSGPAFAERFGAGSMLDAYTETRQSKCKALMSREAAVSLICRYDSVRVAPRVDPDAS